MAVAYDRWAEYVQVTVPPERLLVFPASDGWEPLCEFLKPLQKEEIDQGCREVLQSGEAYPYVNDATSFRLITSAIRNISLLTELSPILLLVLLSVLGLKLYGRAKPMQKAKVSWSTKTFWYHAFQLWRSFFDSC
jgi:hypothetical protein